MAVGDCILIAGHIVRVTEIHPRGWHVRGHGKRRDGEYDFFIFHDSTEELLKRARLITNPYHKMMCSFMGL